jgi:hypothetical protein
VATHHDAVPRFVEQRALFGVVEIQIGTRHRLVGDDVPKSGLIGECFEERGHAAIARAVQIGDGLHAIALHRRALSVEEAVADEQNRLGARNAAEHQGNEERQGCEPTLRATRARLASSNHGSTPYPFRDKRVRGSTLCNLFCAGVL